jgi:hypothetical protein
MSQNILQLPISLSFLLSNTLSLVYSSHFFSVFPANLIPFAPFSLFLLLPLYLSFHILVFHLSSMSFCTPLSFYLLRLSLMPLSFPYIYISFPYTSLFPYTWFIIYTSLITCASLFPYSSLLLYTSLFPLPPSLSLSLSLNLSLAPYISLDPHIYLCRSLYLFPFR